MNFLRKVCGLFALLVFSCMFCEAQPPQNPLLKVMQQELNRSLQNFKKTPLLPYFLSYQLTDNRAITLSASFGALTGSLESATRLLDIDLRVGDFSLDDPSNSGQNWTWGWVQSI